MARTSTKTAKSKPKEAAASSAAASVKETASKSTGSDQPLNLVKKADLIDQVVETCAVKKKDAKPVIEALLGLFAEALSNEKDLSLPPLGKIKVLKSKELEGGAKALTLRLRLAKQETTPPV